MSTSRNPLAGIWCKWSSVPLWLKILTGMLLGIATGVAMGESAEYLKPIGSLFVNTIKMLIVPLVFCSLIVGVTSMQDTQKMGRIGLKSFVFYLGTTSIAITIGLALGYLLEPGAGVQIAGSMEAGANLAKEAPSLAETLVNMIPTNPIAALAQGKILQVIVFAVALGIALVLIGDHGKPAIKLFESLAEAMYKLTDMVMNLAPYGVFALMAWVAGKYGLDVLLPLLKVIIAVYLGCALHIFGFYSLVLAGLSRISPIHFFRTISEAMAVAYTMSSSAGTLPASMKCAKKLGVNKSISSFVLPLGTTINMDGTALYQGVCALFVAQLFGIDLTWVQYLTIIVTATLASIGTAGVPGAGLVMLTLVLTTVGLPLEGVALVAGIDRVLDMARTVVNVSGDLVATTVVAHSEGEIGEATEVEADAEAARV
ncbi:MULTISPECIES: dicarboxylate/amino acid:cation symporter [Ferrimonas]|uniref:dicarboxylate/amino acid:cation symporter n=1 Tax=Ferrimonas TaxID=44011 RepID=UPI00042294B1|nr:MULTISPECIES: dicarboxylate/amino acid:cation symporter [Ferrimonas]USD37141.1 dicarboxylate/amino acid:cation symporter [Ferrimonas sp. SCSIO 43195]